MTLAKVKQHPNGLRLEELAGDRLDQTVTTPSGKVELLHDHITDDIPRLLARIDRPNPELVLTSRRHLRSNNSWLHNVPSLMKGRDRCTLLIHPVDAARVGVASGAAAAVSPTEGAVTVPVEVSDEVMPGVVSLPHGWGHGLSGTRMDVANAHPGVNNNVLNPTDVIDLPSNTHAHQRHRVHGAPGVLYGSEGALTPTPRRGRPARIDRASIVKAALEIGTENITMRKVAQHLGVSLPGLYHHVKNQDELLRLVAQGALVDSPPPRYAGEHWATWLRAYATYVRNVLAAEPALLEKFISGAIHDDGEMDYIGEALDALTSQGLQPDDAMAVWAAVSAMAIGSVSEAHREYLQAERGQPWLARIFRLTARRPSSDYPALRAVAESAHDPFGAQAFQQRITLLLRGIAVEYGLSVADEGAR